jgi:hypothetical protein
MAYEIKRNDLRPYWRVQLTQNGSPADITGATAVRFIMKVGTTGAAKVNRQPMTVFDAPTGVVEYHWSGTDTDTSNTFNAEVEVDWGGSVFQTFPSKGYFTVTISDDLG